MFGLGVYLTIIETEEDQRKFERIYNTYKYRMYWICNDILKDHHLAEDALQEAFLNIIMRLNVIEDASSRRTVCYVCLIAKSRVQKHNVIFLGLRKKLFFYMPVE